MASSRAGHDNVHHLFPPSFIKRLWSVERRQALFYAVGVSDSCLQETVILVRGETHTQLMAELSEKGMLIGGLHQLL